jgi:hypothetical protein
MAKLLGFSERKGSSMIYAIGVDISIAFCKDVYYFRYKGVDFKYVPHYKSDETDDLVCKIPKGSSQPQMFELMTEFLSAFTFANNAQVVVHSGINSQVDAKLNNVNIRFSVKRSINPSEPMDDFYKIALLNTPEQIQLARLYREANSSNNIYLQILFFWHCVVYPSKDDNEAVDYIDNLVGNWPPELEYMRERIKRITSNKIFLSDSKNKDVNIGKYVKDSIRHSIAHIVRKSDADVNLRLDSWEQLRHLHDVEAFLRCVARYRLENEYTMKASNDTEIFRYINEDELT